MKSAQVKPRYTVRWTEPGEDLDRVQTFRAAFFGAGSARDSDAFDAHCRHVSIDCSVSGRTLCCFRLLPLPAEQIGESYSAQFYDLSKLRRYGGRVLEIGRFCVDSRLRDPDVLRFAWAALTAFVDANGIDLLFGCTSFSGTSPARYLPVFALLNARHLAPARWAPEVRAGEVFRFAEVPPGAVETLAAMRLMPPLMRSYLSMGGWVSDHVVIDRRLDTLHVFTGVEVAAIPPARARSLRALA